MKLRFYYEVNKDEIIEAVSGCVATVASGGAIGTDTCIRAVTKLAKRTIDVLVNPCSLIDESWLKDPKR